MKILFLLFSIFLFLFQAAPGSAESLFPDTAACRSQGNFCRVGVCPPTFTISGSCHGGLLHCCAKIPAE
ncbi:gallinacin-10-like [Coturnix japonica]|uniref:Avian beta-defensin 10 n=1 Tax=Coturnix japonica TaxID=93934 RepID=A0A0U5A3X8_COTJA|nr:gallinacin-10-like [Coturnix japonica]BAT57461.1 avian beta-defensin 10 [Coturnix japonica]BAT57462.1 avian beta-defensin 10 [Coturnix japonica]BAT57475.1 avian beta-defensin 10 [Coturnix japonica]BAT57483.1 avian beta-defensin 10 [Coturnix japonica]BBP06450.1 avian beta-defensin 10 [Coturnix japonica]